MNAPTSFDTPTRDRTAPEATTVNGDQNATDPVAIEGIVVEAHVVEESPLREHLSRQRSNPEAATLPDRDSLRLWLAQLDALEDSLDEVEGMLGSDDLTDVPGWAPSTPEDSPIPPELIPRARFIMERQMSLAHEVARRLVATKQEIDLTNKVKDSAPLDVPFYLDTRA